jgi:hypothetical protein
VSASSNTQAPMKETRITKNHRIKTPPKKKKKKEKEANKAPKIDPEQMETHID